MSNKLINVNGGNKEDQVMKICSFIFCLFFFAFFARLIYQEYFNYESEYEYTTGTIIEISETSVKNRFKIKAIHTIKSTWYIIKVELDDGEIIEIPSQDIDTYMCGNIVKIRKVIEVRNGERKVVNYNLLSE